MKINREDVVQSALIVERWCRENFKYQSPCDCPFAIREGVGSCKLFEHALPFRRHLEEFLRNRGLKGGESNAGTPGADSGAN